MDIVLYRPSWQKLRVSCIQDFNQFQGFKTVNGATDNLNRLTNYIQDAYTPAPYAVDEARSMGVPVQTEFYVRVYRAWNFIHSVLNGLASLRLPHMVQVQNYYDELNTRVYTGPVVQMADKWDWNVVNDELKIMWINERVWFQRIADDMKQRVVEKDQTSPNMLKFKELMDAINTI
jgi:hypothetical protein